MTGRIFINVLLLLVLSASVHAQKARPNNSISALKFLSEYDVANGAVFNGTTIGGLSGIDYDTRRNVYYLISDDRSAINEARFYTAHIRVNNDKIDTIAFIAVTKLLQKNGQPYPNSKRDPLHTPDPEGIRYNPRGDELVWSSEGERIVRPGDTVLEDPSVISIDRNGNYVDSFVLPANMHMRETENGPRQNSVFEGISFTNDFRNLFVSVEEPIYEDGPRAGLNDSTALIRILKFKVKTFKPVSQYAYKIDPVAHPAVPPGSFKINGVPDILWIGKNKLIVIERSFSTGRAACTIKVFLADMTGATDVASVNSLLSNPNVTVISKKLLVNMDELGRYIDNIEGVTFGPTLPNGHRTLVFVADNNFSPLQKNQFLLFEVIP